MTSVFYERPFAHLVLVQFTVFEFFLAFALKSYDHKTNEDVHHEKSDDYYINNIVHSYPRSIILQRTFVYFSGIDRIIKNSKKEPK